MVSEYRFLRFEIAGLFTVFFLSVMILPMEAHSLSILKTAEFGLTAVASLFLFSLPLGYWEHQLVVNKYRSGKRKRKVHDLLRDMLVNGTRPSALRAFFQKLPSGEENSFLTTLSEICIYSKSIGVESGIFERLGDRWSHFYARKAVAVYAPVFGIIGFGIFVGGGVLGYWPIELGLAVISVPLGALLMALNYAFINPYSKKIWQEIDLMEASIFLANMEKIGGFLDS